MNNIIHDEPIELASAGLSVGEFEEPVLDPDDMCELNILAQTDGTSFKTKIRLYSVDVSQPSGGLSGGLTLSIGSVENSHVNILVTNDFTTAVLVTKFGQIKFYNGNIKRISVTPEDSKCCSVILDVGGALISKS